MNLSTLCLKQRQCNCNALVLIGCTHWLAAFLSPFSPLSLTVASEQSHSLVMVFAKSLLRPFQCLCFLVASFILVTEKASSSDEGTCIIHAKLHQGEGGVRTVVVSIRIGSQSENGHLQAPNTPLANILTPPQCVASLQSRPSESEKLFTNTRSPTCHPRLIGGRRWYNQTLGLQLIFHTP